MPATSSTKRVTVILAGSAAGLEKTFTEASVAADAASKEMSGAFEVSGERTAGAFSKLGTLFAGIPVLGSSFAKMGEAVEGADTKSGRFFENLANVGKIATVAGVAGLAAAAVASIKLAEGYQTATATLQGSANISAGAAKQIGDAFLSTGFKTVFSAQQQMQAYSAVAAQLGTIQGKALDAAQAQQFMAAAGDLAEGSGSNLTTTTAALSSVMQAFHISTAGAAGASDDLFNAARFTNTGVQQVATAVDKLHARLGVAVPSLTDTAALMTELGEHGVTGTKGITTVSTALTTLLGGSKATSAELKALGVNVFDSSGKFIGMQGVIGALGPKLAKMSQEQQLAAEKTLFGSSAAQIMGQVMQGGVAGYDAAAAAVSRTGSAATAAAAQNETLGKQLDLLKTGAEDLGVKFGEYLIPKLEAAGHEVAKLMGWLEDHTTVVKVFGAVILAALVPALAAAAVSAVAAAAPFLAIGAAIAGVAYGIDWLIKKFHLMPDIKQWGKDIEKVIGALPQAFNALKEAFDHTLEFPSNQYSGIGKAFVEVGFIARDVFDVVKRIPEALEHAFANTQHAFDNTEHAFGNLWHALTNLGNAVMDTYRAIAHAVDNIIHAFGNMVTFIQAVPGFFEALPGRIVGELEALPGQLLNLFEQGFEWVIAGIIAFDIKVAEYFASLPGKVLDAVVKFGPGIVEWMASAFWALDGAIASGVEDAVKFFVGIPGKLLHAVIEFGPGVAKWMADAFVSLVQVAVDGETAVTKFFLSIPGKIVTALGDATKWLYGIGEDIIKGLIKGMEDVIPDVAKTAEHIASGIKNKVTSLLGIHSPSTVFAEIGSNIALGLAQGITAKAPMATAASAKMASAASAGAVGGGGGSSSSKQPVYITVQIAGKNVGQAFVPDLLAFQKSGGVLAINRQGRAITGTA